ncbi:MAG: gluconate 2-dehydrogenase subunit 3 family protein [Pedosphaera sp.]|nr:gluconate 2-dehydrogenase subunit 3 family protein [Pedosphaera sp.]
MNNDEPKRMNRREALKWVGAAVLAYPLLQAKSFGAGAGKINHTLSDPDLMHPGKLWERTLSKEELRTVTALCDVIIPADEKSPSASKVGVPDFIDEWVSAPYPTQEEDKKLIQDGLVWMNTESKKRFEKDFADLTDEQKIKICDEICFVPKAKAEFAMPALFFARFRDLVSSGFYTTKEGMKDLQYIGNTPLVAFRGPPKEVLQHLKLI